MLSVLPRITYDIVQKNRFSDLGSEKGSVFSGKPVYLAFAVLFGSLFLILSGVGYGADVTVTNPNDSGTGSLREAISLAPSAGTIEFNPSLAGQTITLQSALVIDRGVTLDASGLSGGVTILGNGGSRLFYVNPSVNLTLRSLTLSGGSAVGTTATGFGGAIYNQGITSIDRCKFSGNSASTYGGAIYNYSGASLTINDTSFAGNSTGLNGGAISNSSNLSVNRSTFSGNTSSYQGGGLYNDFSGVVTITNSTFTANTALHYGGAIFNGGTLNIASATLAGNNADRSGGGVYKDFLGTLALDNSLVVKNTAPEGTNIFGVWTGTHNLTTGDAKLSPLGNWGGFTQTMPPLPDSPAIDAGGSTQLLTDQRGLARVLHGGLDIGAFETAISTFNSVGLTLHARVSAGDTEGNFEISADPNFLPVVSTLAGTGVRGFADGNRLSSQLAHPSGVTQDTQGNTFFADTANNRIRMIAPDGVIVTIAGDGTYGRADGSGPTAKFAFPSSLAIGPDQNVYVSDTFNHRICKLTRPAAPGGLWTVTTLAGTGTAGFVEGAGSVARFHYPYGLSLDLSGNVYVADSYNHRIRKITSTGVVSTYAGSGVAGFANSANALAARFNTPRAVVVSAGTIYVADTLNHCVRAIIAPGTVPNAFSGLVAGAVSNFAGPTDSTSGVADGSGASAKFNAPSGLASDGQGSLYVVDENNHRIRKIISTGEVSTIAGASAAFVNGNSTVARFHSPTGIVVGIDGNLIVADVENHVLRRIFIKPITVPATSFTDATGTQASHVLDAAALGLDPSSTYYFRWKSTTTGITQPLGQSFFLYELPVVKTEIASNLIPTSARLNATVDPKVGPTTITFEYSTDAGLLHPQLVTTLAGSGATGFVDGTGAAARFSDPTGLVSNANGDVFVTDRLNQRIRKISSTGVVTTFAGNGEAGFANSQTGLAAQFEKPSGIAIDSAGNLYIADESNHRIRMITPAGVVSTFAGTGIAGFADGASAAARFLYPTGVAVDTAGNVYVADAGNHRIRKITAGNVTTLAGSGSVGFSDGMFVTAQFSSPQSVAVDLDGNVYVADTGNHRVRLIDAEGVYTLAGGGSVGFANGTGTNAQFSSPRGIAVDQMGVVYVADSGNHRIRRVSPEGVVTTLAGSGLVGHENSPLTGLYPATASQFDSPVGLGLDSTGRLFVAEAGMIRKIARSATMPTVIVTPDSTGTGERPVFAAINQPLLPGTTYYFRALGSNYRGSVTGEIQSFVTPQPAMSVFAGAGTSGSAIGHNQAAAIDFGITPTGKPVTRSFTISNPGSWPLTVSSIDLPTGFQVASGNAVINPLASRTFDIILSATGGGHFGGNLVINSDAPGQPVFTFPISGVVVDRPVISNLAATSVGTGSATFNAFVNPSNSSTTVWFEWSLDQDFDGVRVTTVAGAGTGNVGGMAKDTNGNLYIADTLNHRIRKIAVDGSVSVFAGTGVAGFSDGLPTTAQFNQPVGLAMSTTGILYVADSNNHRIRAIGANGEVTTFSGLGLAGFTDGIATAARFDKPVGLAIDASGTLYVADSGNHRIRKIALDGASSTLAGTGIAGATNGASPQFSSPSAIAIDATGFIYVTDSGSHAIRKIAADGFTSVFVGSQVTSGFADATGGAARFSNPAGLAFGTDGLLYVADQGNHRIRTISPTGLVLTIAGSAEPGMADGVGEVATFSSPVSLISPSVGTVMVGETGRSSLRKIAPLQIQLQAATGLTGTANVAVALPVSGLPPVETYYYRAIATNAGGTTIGSTQASRIDPFHDWQVANFGANASDPLIAGMSASPAGDGVPNLLKYAFGLDPNVAKTGDLTVMGLDANLLTLTYTKILAATDLDYTVEWSTDLAIWSSVGVDESILSGDSTSQQILAAVPRSSAAMKFIRIRISLP